jgi:hypothetical protein
MNKYNAILLYKSDATEEYGWYLISTQLDYSKTLVKK